MRMYDLHTTCDQLEVMLRAPESRWYYCFCHRHSEAKHLDQVECRPMFYTDESCTSLYGHMNSEKRGLFFTWRAACEIPLAIMLRPCEPKELK